MRIILRSLTEQLALPGSILLLVFVRILQLVLMEIFCDVFNTILLVHVAVALGVVRKTLAWTTLIKLLTGVSVYILLLVHVVRDEVLAMAA